MAKVLLSAFADEYSKDIDVQIQLCREQKISYLEPRFINEKNRTKLHSPIFIVSLNSLT